jgi:hypothetical protein
MRGYYSPKIKYSKPVDKCSNCKKKTDLKDLMIVGIDENNWKITQNAAKSPICRKCIDLKSN